MYITNTIVIIVGEIKKSCMQKSQLHNKYIKCKSKSNWENYRQQRNLVTKIMKKSI
jgi:hypothetical protein